MNFDITLAPIEELQRDRAESVDDIAMYETQLRIMEIRKHRLDEKIAGNKEIIRTIDDELQRRNA